MKTKSAFSLFEMTIIIGLIMLIATGLLIALNPFRQIQKAWNSKRKSDLNGLKRIFEDFNNDKNRYPTAAEVCYDPPTSPRIDSYGNRACSCHICGHRSGSPANLSPYADRLPCYPHAATGGYLYDFDCSTTTPRWYRLYTVLDFPAGGQEDPETIAVNCTNKSCGPAPARGYNYGVVSGNTDLER